MRKGDVYKASPKVRSDCEPAVPADALGVPATLKELPSSAKNDVHFLLSVR